MTFDISMLARTDFSSSKESRAKVAAFIDEVIQRFVSSEEGRRYAERNSEGFSNIRPFIEMAADHLNLDITAMNRDDVEDVLTELFPRKLTLESPEDAKEIVPEIRAFWQFLLREYDLPEAPDILEFLDVLEPEFPSIMNDPANFGMAKTLFALAKEKGFDMTTNEGKSAFMQYYNSLPREERFDTSAFPGQRTMEVVIVPASKKMVERKRSRRVMAKTSRRKNRKK